MSVLPWPYRQAVLAALGIALVGFGWIKGAPALDDLADQLQVMQLDQQY